jgi:hypothetical protein
VSVPPKLAVPPMVENHRRMDRQFSLKGDDWSERELKLVALIVELHGRQVQMAAHLVQVELKHGNLPADEIPKVAQNWAHECLQTAAKMLGLELVEEGA